MPGLIERWIRRSRTFQNEERATDFYRARWREALVSTGDLVDRYMLRWNDDLRAHNPRTDAPRDLRLELIRRKRLLRHLDNPEEGTVINNFLVGCDPEFVALDSKGTLLNVANAISQEGEVGYDHSGRVLELRPQPARGTFALVKRLQALLSDDRIKTIVGYGYAKKFRAGAKVGPVTLGGHVHFGFPHSRDTKLFQSKIQACDKVTTLLEHLDILPTNESKQRRDSGEYGQYGQTRASGDHTEYRTMASWLYDPRVAYLCLTAAKLAASDPAGALEALTNVTSFEGLKRWFERYKNKDANATRAVDNVLALGHKRLVVDPDVDFRERWGRLGI